MRRLAEPHPVLHQQGARPYDPATHHIAMKGLAGGDLEPMAQMRAAGSDFARQGADGERLVEVVFDIVSEPSKLSLGQAAAARAGGRPFAKDLCGDRDSHGVRIDRHGRQVRRRVPQSIRQMDNALVAPSVAQRQVRRPASRAGRIGDAPQKRRGQPDFDGLIGRFSHEPTLKSGRDQIDVALAPQMAIAGLPAE